MQIRQVNYRCLTSFVGACCINCIIAGCCLLLCCDIFVISTALIVPTHDTQKWPISKLKLIKLSSLREGLLLL